MLLTADRRFPIPQETPWATLYKKDKTGGGRSRTILVLHSADLPESDVEIVQGFKLTRPLRAILDLIEAGTVERNFIHQAITQAVDRGLITREQIRNTKMSGPARKIVAEALRRAA